jgi:hypothetical protein
MELLIFIKMINYDDFDFRKTPEELLILEENQALDNPNTETLRYCQYMKKRDVLNEEPNWGRSKSKTIIEMKRKDNLTGLILREFSGKRLERKIKGTLIGLGALALVAATDYYFLPYDTFPKSENIDSVGKMLTEDGKRGIQKWDEGGNLLYRVSVNINSMSGDSIINLGYEQETLNRVCFGIGGCGTQREVMLKIGDSPYTFESFSRKEKQIKRPTIFNGPKPIHRFLNTPDVDAFRKFVSQEFEDGIAPEVYLTVTTPDKECFVGKCFYTSHVLRAEVPTEGGGHKTYCFVENCDENP